MESRGRFSVTITRTIDPARLTAPIAEPLRCSLPLPQGVLWADAACTLLDDRGRRCDQQPTALARWADGSVKWLLLEFSWVPDAPVSTYSLLLNDGPGAGDRASLGTLVGDGVVLRSGDLSVRLDPASGIELTRQGIPAGSIAIECTSADGSSHTLHFDSVSLEWNGSQRATALACGRLLLKQGVLNVALRLSTCAANSQITCDLTIHNPRRAAHEGNFWELGDPGSVLFNRVAVVLRTHLSQPAVLFAETPEHWEPAPGPVSVYQESSGGANWNSRAHVDRTGTVPMSRPGYVVQAAGGQREGRRTQPAVQLADAEHSWAATLLNFWQEFPSEIRAAPDGIVVEPFPGAFPVLHELQGGERKTRSCVFAHGSRTAAQSVIAVAIDPSLAAASPGDVRASDVLPFLDAEEDPGHHRLLSACLEGDSSFAAKRERIDEYGWRNFGDVFADHESAFLNDGSLFVSHYNNQYDPIFGFGFQFLRTGDARWWRLMDDLARHVADIDIYHTDEDKPAYNHGMFWHTYHYVDAGTSTHRSYPRGPGISGGGPAAEQNYSAGLALHYLLTGWIPSRDAAIGLGRWVIDMDDGAKTPFGWLTRARTGLASASGNSYYHGPGRAGGNSIQALLVAFELTGDRVYVEKAEELIRRCIHPADDIASLNLPDAERRWYYTVFLESVGRYLWCKREHGELDAMYDYARRALLHYARWMREHEYPYLERPEILEYPTETWSAQDIRKSDVLAWAALCERGEERARFLAASRRFLDDVLTRLPSMPTWTYTRPLVLMLARGYSYNWVSRRPDIYLAAAPARAADPPPSRFEPQKAIAIRRAMALIALSGVAFVVLLAMIFLR